MPRGARGSPALLLEPGLSSGWAWGAFSGEVGCAAGLTQGHVRASGVGRDKSGCQEDTVSLGAGGWDLALMQGHVGG